MYAQLGSQVFDGQFAPDSFSREDATVYATHALISAKPKLQPIANELETIALTINLRAEFCKVEDTILAFKNSKDTFETLPFLLGNGRYLGDYVITSMSEAWNQQFADGQLIDATVNLSLTEYQTVSKLAQQQSTARKQAFAVGNKKPVLTGLVQPNTLPQTTVQDISAINSEGVSINNQVLNYQNNISERNSISKDIGNSLNNMAASLESYRTKTQSLTAFMPDTDLLETTIQSLSDVITGITIPVTDYTVLSAQNTAMQSVLVQFNSINTTLNFNVIIRRA